MDLELTITDFAYKLTEEILAYTVGIPFFYRKNIFN